jgi:hypothetical protein
MTNTIERVSPVQIDGIEFYCSLDGEKTGMSVAGLAKFVGMPRMTLRDVLTQIDNPGGESNQETLKAIALVPKYHTEILGDKQGGVGQVLTAEFCAEVCAYIAYEHKGGNATARYSLKKFTASGINNFIKEVTGHRKVGDLSQTNEILSRLVDSVDKMQVKLDQCGGYLKARVEYPGLEKWMNAIDTAVEETKQLEGDVPLYTLSEAMEKIYPGMTFSRGQRSGVGGAIAETYKNMKLAPAQQIKRLDDKGYQQGWVCGYPETMFPVIKACLLRVLSAL